MKSVEQVKQLYSESKIILETCNHINKEYWKGYIKALEKVLDDKRWCYGMMDLNKNLECELCSEKIYKECYKLSFNK